MSRQGTANSINNQIPNHQAPPSPRQMGRATANNIRDQLNSLNDALPPISPSAHSSLASRGGTAEGRQQPILTTSANRVIKTNQSSIGTKSKVVGFEVLLRETFSNHPSSPHNDRIAAAFRVFDELLMGSQPIYISKDNVQLMQLLKAVRDEFFNSIYCAENYTVGSLEAVNAAEGFAASSSGNRSAGASINHIPFFTLTKRLVSDGKQTKEEDTWKIVDLEKKLRFREKDMNLLTKKNFLLKQQIMETDEQCSQLRKKLSSVENTAQLAANDRKQQEEEYQRLIKVKSDQLETVHNNLEKANETIKDFAQMKMSLRELDKRPHAPRSLINKKDLTDFCRVNALNMIRQDLFDSMAIQQQMHGVFHNQLDEYEGLLRQLKRKQDQAIMQIERSEQQNQTDNIDQILQMVEAERKEIMIQFQLRSKLFMEEEIMLKQHLASLKITFDRFKRLGQIIYHGRQTDEGSRRFGVMVQFSDDGGKTFRFVPNIPQCNLCGDELVFCQHQTADSLLIPLHQSPASWTTLKFTRSLLQVPVLSMTELRAPEYISMLDEDDVLKQEAEMAAEAAAEEESFQPGFEPEYFNTDLSATIRTIWRNFYRNRKQQRPKFFRNINVEQLLTFIDDLYDHRFRLETEHLEKFVLKIGNEVDGGAASRMKATANLISNEQQQKNQTSTVDDEFNTGLPELKNLEFIEDFQDFFYHFVCWRYPEPQIANQACYEILLAMQNFETKNLTVGMFIRHLTGEDEISWKYVRLIRKMLELHYTSIDINVYREATRIIYPYRPKATYDHMELDEIGYNRNRWSADLMEDRIKHAILLGNEPNYKTFARIFREFDHQKRGTMSMEEFVDTMGYIYPPAPTFLKVNRFRLAVNKKADDPTRISLDIAARIASYCVIWSAAHMSMWQRAPDLTDSGDQKFLGQVKIDPKIYQITPERTAFIKDLQVTMLPGVRVFWSTEDLMDEQEELSQQQQTEQKQQKHNESETLKLENVQ